MRAVVVVAAVLLGTSAAPAAEAAGALDRWLDRVGDALAVTTPGGLVRAKLGALADVEGYWIDQRPPGLLHRDYDFVNPRLTLLLDTEVGRRVYGFVQARVDRGFDPGAESGVDARADEYLLRVSPFADARLHLQVGKFATLVGNWVPRHLSWDNPFVTAPLPYERVTAVSDARAAPPAEFLARRAFPDDRREWVPMIWGPSYASGAAAFGRVGALEWGGELKNAAPSARPAVWDGTERGWDAPTVSGRLGWRPGAAWAVGVSGSRGTYLRSRAQATLARGRHARDYHQSLVGADASYAVRHLELWAEFWASRFEVPRVGQADVAAWYVEGRYKVARRLFAALRWNQQVFGDVDDGRGGETPWDRDAWRLDAAATWRPARHLQVKLQYGVGRQRRRPQQGQQLVAAQLTLRF
jgi:hypothetical protein